MKKLGMFVLGFAAVVFAGSLAQAASDDDMGEAKKFSMHGEVRFRGEWFTNLSDGTDTDENNGNSDDTFDVYPWRVRFGALGDLGNDVYVYGEFQGVGLAGHSDSGYYYYGNNATRDPYATSAGTEVDLYQGYIKWKDVGSSNMDLTFGRQEIVFDRGLHFSSLDFYNGISHDGVMAAWDYENFGIHGFWVKTQETNFPGFFFGGNTNDVDQADDDLYGVHFKHMLGKDKNQDVAYYLFYQDQRFFGLGGSKIYTLGGRWGKEATDKDGIFWNAELAIQSGDNPDIPGDPNSSFDQEGMIFEGSIGWAFADAKHQVWIGALMASGDDDPNDDKNGTYQPLYTDYHNRLGYADLFSPQNITALSVGWKFMANERHGGGVTLYQFTKTEDEDFVYNSPSHFFSNGSPSLDPCVSGGAVSCEDDLGTEIDLFYNYHPTGNFGFDVAWSIYTPGDAMEDTVTIGGNPETVGDDTGWRLTAQARARW